MISFAIWKDHFNPAALFKEFKETGLNRGRTGDIGQLRDLMCRYAHTVSQGGSFQSSFSVLGRPQRCGRWLTTHPFAKARPVPLQMANRNTSMQILSSLPCAVAHYFCDVCFSAQCLLLPLECSQRKPSLEQKLSQAKRMFFVGHSPPLL